MSSAGIDDVTEQDPRTVLIEYRKEGGVADYVLMSLLVLTVIMMAFFLYASSMSIQSSQDRLAVPAPSSTTVVDPTTGYSVGTLAQTVGAGMSAYNGTSSNILSQIFSDSNPLKAFIANSDGTASILNADGSLTSISSTNINLAQQSTTGMAGTTPTAPSTTLLSAVGTAPSGLPTTSDASGMNSQTGGAAGSTTVQTY